ncbi:MAG: phage tail protein [Chloroflexota bacterium]|nr:phage tail protein [Chloroflexota bacterium]
MDFGNPLGDLAAQAQQAAQAAENQVTSAVTNAEQQVQELTHAGDSDHEWVTAREVTHAGDTDHEWVTTREITHAGPSDHEWVTAREITHAGPSDHRWVTARERTSTDPGARRRSATNNNTDVLTTVHFYIQIAGINEAVFSELSGFEAETEVVHYREGGLNGREHHLLGASKINEITLKNGITNSKVLWDWYVRVLQGPPWGETPRKKLDIVMVDQTGRAQHQWTFLGALPVKWTGPQLTSGQSQAAVQSLKIAHQGLLLPASR